MDLRFPTCAHSHRHVCSWGGYLWSNLSHLAASPNGYYSSNRRAIFLHRSRCLGHHLLRTKDATTFEGASCRKAYGRASSGAIVQNILFVGLAEAKVFFPKPPYHVSYNDFTVGVPNLLFLIELGIMSIMFLWSFEFKRYRQEIRNGTPKAAGPVKAFFSTFYPDDVFRGLIYAFTFSPSSVSKASRNYASVKNERDGPLEMAADH